MERSSTHMPEDEKSLRTDPPNGVLERGLAILGCFNREVPRQKMHEIASRTGLDRATVSRALKTFVQAGYLLKSDDGYYSPGPTNLRLASLFTTNSTLLTRIQLPLDEISRRTGQTSSFFMRSSQERICLARDSTLRSIRYFLDVGASIPLSNGGSAAKLLQAFTEPDSDVASDIQQAGHYISWGELHPQMASVAVPVFESNHAFLGAVAITGFKEELSVERLRHFALIAEEELSKLGFEGVVQRIPKL